MGKGGNFPELLDWARKWRPSERDWTRIVQDFGADLTARADALDTDPTSDPLARPYEPKYTGPGHEYLSAAMAKTLARIRRDLKPLTKDIRRQRPAP